MAFPSPLRAMYLDAGIDLVGFGSPTTPGGAAAVPAVPELAMVVESLELEYAAIRKACALMDEPHRAIIEVTGADRLGFLNRMLTQELKGLGEYRVARSFWLNRKGRIDADAVVIVLPDRVWLDVDVHAVQRTIDGLASFIVMDDVALRDASQAWHRLSLHGPTAPLLLDDVLVAPVGVPRDGAALPSQQLQPGHAIAGAIQTRGGTPALGVIVRDDPCGVFGVSIHVPAELAGKVFQALIERGHSHARAQGLSILAGGERGPVASLPVFQSPAAPAMGGGGINADKIRLRLAGWHAFNIARVEAGTPLYLLDFGPESLPHETGVIRDRVNFKKGCYLGQEVVARMESRGHSKSTLVKLRAVESFTGPLESRLLPEAGAALRGPDAANSEPVGRVTSSVLSPRLGSQPIALASVKPALAAGDTRVLVECAEAPGGWMEMLVGALNGTD